MFQNGRKTIGVIICDVSSHYQEQVCQTLSSYARVAGYNLAYFSLFTSYGVDTRNGRGEANIVHLIPFEKLDAIVFCHDTLPNEAAKEFIWESIKKRCSCPVVTLRQAYEDYPCVLVNQQHGIEDLVYHYVDVHKRTRLAFMSGPFEHPDSIKRLENYQTALKNRGIPYDERLVFEGDFWRNKAKEAARYFTMELDELPEAIICANDYMANSLMNELIAKGFLVPDDIAISGFDDIWESSITLPPITTVSVSAESMAKEAMHIIEDMWEGKETESVRRVDAEVVFRNSCGCQTFNMQSMLAKRVRQVNEYQQILDSNQNNTYMFIGLTDLDRVEGIEKYLRLQDLFNDHVESLYICLCEGRGDQYPKYRSASSGYAKKCMAVGGVNHRKPIKMQGFDTVELLPDMATDKEPMIYYFYPLHNNQYSFGYLAISFEGIHCVNKTFSNWLAILGNALETIRIKQKNQRLLQELNNLYVHDALTGLYNRRGFDSVSEDCFLRAQREDKSFVVIAIDMDNLKVVNDRYGHMNGDLALKTIAAAMQHVADLEDACARVGGDEYNVVGVGHTEQEIEDFIQDFNDYLKDFNSTSGLPYLVKASIGYSLIMPNDDHMGLEACINAADTHLYEYKRNKKKLNKDNVLRDEEF